jgi:hypothetical protein
MTPTSLQGSRHLVRFLTSREPAVHSGKLSNPTPWVATRTPAPSPIERMRRDKMSPRYASRASAPIDSSFDELAAEGEDWRGASRLDAEGFAAIGAE